MSRGENGNLWMKKNEAKEYLMMLSKQETAVKTAERGIQDLKELMMSIGGMNSGERVQKTRDNDRFGTIYAKIDEKERILETETLNLVELRFKVSEEIQMLKNARYVELLHRHYVKGETFLQIADKMGYSYRYVTKMHGKALEEFGAVIQREGVQGKGAERG